MNYFLAKLRNHFLRFRLRRRELDPLAYTNIVALDQLKLQSTVRSFRYVVFDLETTGLDLDSDQIVSIGAFRIVEGRIRLDDMFNRLVNPGRNIPPNAVKIHGIVPAMVVDAPNALDVLKDFLTFIKGDILIAHQAHYDMHFMNRLMRQLYGFPLQNLVLDTILMCQKIAFPPHPYPYGIDMSVKKYSLDAISKFYGIEIQQRHTAIGDALATAMIFQRIIGKLEKDRKDTLHHLIKVAGVH